MREAGSRIQSSGLLNDMRKHCLRNSRYQRTALRSACRALRAPHGSSPRVVAALRVAQATSTNRFPAYLIREGDHGPASGFEHDAVLADKRQYLCARHGLWGVAAAINGGAGSHGIRF